MKVTRIAWTWADYLGMSDQTDGVWSPEDGFASDLSEFAGRACYQSWTKPNPLTATNESYLGHILKVNHGSVLEHGTVTFYITEVSRSLTHELVRHRHFSYSQLSQRFVLVNTKAERKVGDGYVTPPLFRGDGIASVILEAAWTDATEHYDQLVERALELLNDLPEDDRPGNITALKMAREAARAVLPNMTPTAIVVTGNHRAWREAILKRASLEADAEIAELFVEIFQQLNKMEPNIYQDMHKMNNGSRDWVCGCAPHGTRSVVWHNKHDLADDGR
jgi:thymidylate synthase (FAD)